jgi:Sulfotransferase family
VNRGAGALPDLIEKDRLKTTDILRPILVQGIGRGGTTLLMQILGTSPEIVFDRIYPFETGYLRYLLNWAIILENDWPSGANLNSYSNMHSPSEALGPFPDKGSQLWDGRELWPACFQTAWKEFSRIATERTRAGGNEAPLLYYAEKTQHWVPAFLRRAMSYKSILLVRDPRDIFLSVTAFDKKRGFPGFNRRASDDDWSFARRFVDDCREPLRKIMEGEADPDSVLVKYESLVLDMANESQRVSEHLGVDLDIGVIDKQRYEFHMTSNSAKESVERWRRELPAEFNQFFVSNFYEELKHFGYET